MTAFVAGLVVGIISLLPPGPITLSIVALGATRGSGYSTRAGIGVGVADAVVVLLCGLALAAGTALPERVYAAVRIVSLTTVAMLGIALIARTTLATGFAERVKRPVLGFSILTLSSPWVFTGWFALLAAAPFSARTDHVTFAVGLAVASLAYHLVLGRTAGFAAERLSPRLLARATRLGGGLTIASAFVMFAVAS